MIGLTVKKLRNTDAVKIDNICKKGISFPLKAGSLLKIKGDDPSTSINFPDKDQSYTFHINC